MNFCESCGAKLEKHMKFCEACGAKVPSAETSTTDSVKPKVVPVKASGEKEGTTRTPNK